MNRTKSAILMKGSAIASLPDDAIRLPTFVVAQTEQGEQIALDGVWTTRTVGTVDKQLRAFRVTDGENHVIINCRSITMLDTAGAWMIARLRMRLEGSGDTIEVVGLSNNHQILYDAVMRAALSDESQLSKGRLFRVSDVLAGIGKGTNAFWLDFLASMNILGAAVRGSQMKSGHSSGFSLAPVVSQMDKMGVGAIPIVMLMSVIMGAIIAQQGAFQLRYFGAEIYVVDLVGILVLREIGVILTAIMVAGRSGSAITAEIGSMKMREEIDALKVIGLNPIGVLIFPRLVALVIVLPLLTFLSNLAALGGAMFVAQTYSGISPDAFITRVHEAVDLTSFFSGMIKAPFMAIIIGIIASVEGMKVGGSAESLGQRVTSSVVKSIFVVIVVDGLFAVFFAAIDF